MKMFYAFGDYLVTMSEISPESLILVDKRLLNYSSLNDEELIRHLEFRCKMLALIKAYWGDSPSQVPTKIPAPLFNYMHRQHRSAVGLYRQKFPKHDQSVAECNIDSRVLALAKAMPEKLRWLDCQVDRHEIYYSTHTRPEGSMERYVRLTTSIPHDVQRAATARQFRAK